MRSDTDPIVSLLIGERAETANLDEAEVLVIGCGNVLLGDDGLGPAVIGHLREYAPLPPHVGLIDAGTGVRALLFNLALAERRLRLIILVDAVDKGRAPGEIFEIKLEDVPAAKAEDFSIHHMPTTNLLKELRDQGGVQIRVIAVQVESIPERVQCGLSAPAAAAVPRVVDLIRGMW